MSRPLFTGIKIRGYSLTVHLGRSHHRGIEISVSVIGGFAVSLLTFTITTVTRNYHAIQGQLLAGDPTQNREFATSLNSMQASMVGENPMLNSMGSYGWWLMVLVGGLMVSFIFFKLVRRYV